MSPRVVPRRRAVRPSHRATAAALCVALALAGCGSTPWRSAAPPVLHQPEIAPEVAEVAPAPAEPLEPVVAAPLPPSSPRTATKPSAALQSLLARVRARDDNAGLPFLVIDKPRARLHVFDARGRSLGDAPVLLGMARGDTSVPGIGEKPLAQIAPAERTTPAGRFVAEKGVNASGEDIVWIDYDAAVSLHRVRVVDPKQRRLERLASPTVADNRISYGCVNVPVRFYEGVVMRAMQGPRAVVYVLPDSLPVASVFPGLMAPAGQAARRAVAAF